MTICRPLVVRAGQTVELASGDAISGSIAALPVFKATLADVKAGYRRGRVLCLGSSETQGAYSASQAFGSTDTPPDLLYKSWPMVLATTQFPAAGIPVNGDTWCGDGNIFQYGASGFSGYNPRLSIANGANVSSGGQLGGNSFFGSSGGLLTYSPASPVTTYEVYAQVIAGGSPIQYYIDAAGASGQLTPSGATNSIVKMIVPATQRVSGQIGLFVKTSGQYVTINGVIAYDAGSPAVDIINCGWNGGVAAQILGGANPDSPLKSIPVFGADLVVLEIGVNDSLRGTDLAAYEATLRTGIATIRAAGADVHIVISPPFQNGGPNAQPPAAQRAAYDSVTRKVAAGQRCPVTDLVAYYASWDAMNAAGLVHDSIHPNKAGYASMAAKIGADLLAASA